MKQYQIQICIWFNYLMFNLPSVSFFNILLIKSFPKTLTNIPFLYVISINDPPPHNAHIIIYKSDFILVKFSNGKKNLNINTIIIIKRVGNIIFFNIINVLL